MDYTYWLEDHPNDYGTHAAVEAPDQPVHVALSKIVSASILFLDVLTKFCIVSVKLAVWHYLIALSIAVHYFKLMER